MALFYRFRLGRAIQFFGAEHRTEADPFSELMGLPPEHAQQEQQNRGRHQQTNKQGIGETGGRPGH